MKIHYRKFVICMISIQSVANDDEDEGKKEANETKWLQRLFFFISNFMHCLFWLKKTIVPRAYQMAAVHLNYKTFLNKFFSRSRSRFRSRSSQTIL